jgi:hypothetical protein
VAGEYEKSPCALSAAVMRALTLARVDQRNELPE